MAGWKRLLRRPATTRCGHLMNAAKVVLFQWSGHAETFMQILMPVFVNSKGFFFISPTLYIMAALVCRACALSPLPLSLSCARALSLSRSLVLFFPRDLSCSIHDGKQRLPACFKLRATARVSHCNPRICCYAANAYAASLTDADFNREKELFVRKRNEHHKKLAEEGDQGFQASAKSESNF